MKFSVRRVILTVFLLMLVWWDGFLFKAWWNYRAEQGIFEKKQKEFLLLADSIKETDSRKTKEEILTKTEEMKNLFFQKFRIGFTNAEIIGFVAKAAGSLGLDDVQPAIQKTRSEGRFSGGELQKTSMRINFRARYHEAARLINLLEQSPYLLKVKIISINRGQKDPTGPVYASVLLDFYRLI